MSTLLSLVAPLCLRSRSNTAARGVEYRSQRDTGAIARAESALAADPRNVDASSRWRRASGVRQYREAIATFTRGLGLARITRCCIAGAVIAILHAAIRQGDGRFAARRQTHSTIYGSGITWAS